MNDRLKTAAAIVSLVLGIVAFAVSVTGIGMVAESTHCDERGGTWTVDWADGATSNCSWRPVQ